MRGYLEKLLDWVIISGAFIWSVISYLCFPDEAYVTAAIAVGIAMLLDIFTKYMALSSHAQGYKNAVRTKVIFSGTLWGKTRIKLTAYLVIAILSGLAYRVTPLEQVGIFFGTVVYSVIFLREAQSILENLLDAGADVEWLIKWTKKKERIILENDDTVQNIGNTQGNNSDTNNSEIDGSEWM